MLAKNIYSIIEHEKAIRQVENNLNKKRLYLKDHEIKTLESFCGLMSRCSINIQDFDGFFISYEIPQIGKEFDLLRFSNDTLINIEIKSVLNENEKERKILDQMKKNYYYLSSTNSIVKIYTYVEEDGIYYFDFVENRAIKVDPSILAAELRNQKVDYKVIPNEMFSPSKFLVSPFSSTSDFINDKYFLTAQQEEIKGKILNNISSDTYSCCTIQANAGTGKTLLMYDVAKNAMKSRNVLLIHCGKLNEGHIKLRTDDNWIILPIVCYEQIIKKIERKEIDTIFVDESQRMWKHQLNPLIEKCLSSKVRLIFAYDVKQYLKKSEKLCIATHIEETFPNLIVYKYNLSNTIRTNKDIFKFIEVMFDTKRIKGISEKDYNVIDYSNITLESISNATILSEYIKFQRGNNWKIITFSTSFYEKEAYSDLNTLSNITAHDVIGQDFQKVIVVLDANFKYKDSKLTATPSQYDAIGMLYQILTRTVEELKIVVTNNPSLYIRLLEIKEKRI